MWDPPKQSVDIRTMMTYSVIPVLDVYALWRIQKFWAAIGISFIASMAVGSVIGVLLGGGILAGLIDSNVYSYVAGYIIGVPVSLVFVRHFAKKYNEKILR